jgi:hypothetical protein
MLPLPASMQAYSSLKELLLSLIRELSIKGSGAKRVLDMVVAFKSGGTEESGRATGRMIKATAGAESFTLMVMPTKVSGLMARLMAEAPTCPWMGLGILANGTKTNSKDSVLRPGQIKRNTKETTKRG